MFSSVDASDGDGDRACCLVSTAEAGHGGEEWPESHHRSNCGVSNTASSVNARRAVVGRLRRFVLMRHVVGILYHVT